VFDLEGGIPRPLPMDRATAGMIRQDGAMVAFNRIGYRYNRKGYRGNNSADIYVQDLRTKEIRRLTDTDIREFRSFVHDASPMWGADGKIYFASERDGTFNIWRIDPAGGEPEQVTRHTGLGVRFPAISPDGRTIIYENDYELWAVDVPNGEPRRIPITLAIELKRNLVTRVTTTNRAEGFAPSPTGDVLAVDFRGEIFLVPVEPEFGEMARVTRSPWRDRFQLFSPDGTKLAYISDESREEEIWIYDLTTRERNKLTTHESVKSNLVWAPDSKRLAFVAANRLFEANVETGVVTELAYNRASGYAGVAYTPDGKCLTYHRSDDDLNVEGYLFELATRREYNVTKNPFRDEALTVTPDGSTVVFISTRDSGRRHLFAASLTRLTEDPDDPLVRARRRAAEDGESRQGRNAAPGQVRVEPDGIERRAVQLTRREHGVGEFFLSRDGRTIYFTSRDDDGPGLFSISIDGRDRRKLTPGTFRNLTPTYDRRMVFWSQPGGSGPGEEVHRLTLANPQRKERVTFSFSVEVDQRGEWEQIFEESWRVMKYRFYDPDMHGVDWDAVKATYRPLLRHVGAYEDVYDLANYMLGELNASHMGVSGPPSVEPDRAYRTRHLGFELEPAGERYRIAHIYRNGPADKEWLNLSVGDYVLAIDGQEIRVGDNYWRILNQAMNEYVPVRVGKNERGEGGGPGRGERPGEPEAGDERVRAGPGREERARRGRAQGADPERDVHHGPDVRGVGREEPGAGGAGDERPDRVRAHSRHEPALPRPVPQRDRRAVEPEGDHRGHPVQRRREHRPGADRDPLPAAVPVLEQPVGGAGGGAAAAAGDRGPEGHADQLAERVGQRGHAAGVPGPGARADRREPDGRGGDRDREL